MVSSLVLGQEHMRKSCTLVWPPFLPVSPTCSLRSVESVQTASQKSHKLAVFLTLARAAFGGAFSGVCWEASHIP